MANNDRETDQGNQLTEYVLDKRNLSKLKSLGVNIRLKLF